MWPDVRERLGELALALLQGFSHVIEAVGERPELVVVAGGHAGVQLTGRDAFGHTRERRQRSGHAPVQLPREER